MNTNWGLIMLTSYLQQKSSIVIKTCCFKTDKEFRMQSLIKFALDILFSSDSHLALSIEYKLQISEKITILKNF